ncbi:hypothetical protein ABZ820_22235 [Streptomyces diacarni]|uniref:hypothetical protein n=1 Tax=Streptomyces diacarni TaxID=2800381 RepID=UPI0033FF8B68
MGDRDWWAEESGSAPGWHRAGPPSSAPQLAASPPAERALRRSRRTWLLVAVITGLVVAVAGVWNSAAEDQRQKEREEKAAAYKGVSATNLIIDGVKVETMAKWNDSGRSAELSVLVNPDEKPSLIHIESDGRTAKEEPRAHERGIPMPIILEVKTPVTDRYQPVQMTVTARGGQRSHQAAHRTVEFRSDRTAIDTKTGKKLKQYRTPLL